MTTHLSFFQILRLLRQHRRLAERRDPIFEDNKAAKWLVGLLTSMTLVYLILFAVSLSIGANGSRRFTAPEFIMAWSPFMVLVDFWVRFIAQQTPAQIIKPYVLQPLPRQTCIDSFVIGSLLSWGNLVWFVLLVPFCIMSVVFGYGVGTALSLLLLFYLIILANSQYYAIVRTLTTANALWWMLPLGVAAALLSPWAVGSFHSFMRFYAHAGSGIESGNIVPHLVAAAVLAGVVAINRRVQYRSVMAELGKQTDATPKQVFRLAALDRLGELGEYLKLEIKLLSRNKNPRKSFISATAVVVVISMLVSFTEMYDGATMANFWCFYCYVIYASMVLTKVMGLEGNYIDVLMVHRENILKLLTAKYYFFCVLLILPFVLMLPMVFMGKWSMLMLVAYGVFTAGFQHFFLMQLAVYNNKTTPLNEKFTSKGGIETNYLQVAESIGAFFLPMIMINVLELFLEQRMAWVAMMGIGIFFIAAHKLWLRNIYRRLMARRYRNMEAFHA